MTIGALGATIGFAFPVAAALVQPPTVCVTLYIPAVVTVIEDVVSPVDHNKLEPVAVKIELPQLSDTVTIGALGALGADNDTISEFEGQLELKLIVYEPPANPVIVNGNVCTDEPELGPDQEIVPVPLPEMVIVPSAVTQSVGFV